MLENPLPFEIYIYEKTLTDVELLIFIGLYS